MDKQSALKWFESVIKTNPCVNGMEDEAEIIRRALSDDEEYGRSIHIRFSDDGLAIRKWAFLPFEDGTEFVEKTPE